MTAYSIVLIGTKPVMNYVTGVVMQFSQNNASEITIKARGKFISKAVDVAEVVTKRFLTEQVGVSKINVGSEDFTTPEGRKVRVSTIAISIAKQSAGPIVVNQQAQRPTGTQQAQNPQAYENKESTQSQISASQNYDDLE